jgi:hypothetical protein
MATNKAQSATQETPTETASPRRPHACACLTGTGETCPQTTLKAFAQGHDARMSSRIAQAIAAGSMTEEAGLKLVKDAGGSDLLIGKTKRSATLRNERASKPAADKAPKADSGPKATKEQADAMAKAPAASVIGTKLKVKHGDKEYDAVVVRNASNDLVARHRIQGKNVDHAVTVTDGVVTVAP